MASQHFKRDKELLCHIAVAWKLCIMELHGGRKPTDQYIYQHKIILSIFNRKKKSCSTYIGLSNTLSNTDNQVYYSL